MSLDEYYEQFQPRKEKREMTAKAEVVQQKTTDDIVKQALSTALKALEEAKEAKEQEFYQLEDEIGKIDKQIQGVEDALFELS